MSESRISISVDASGAETFEIKDEEGNTIGFETVYAE
jgi:hypothetical protein